MFQLNNELQIALAARTSRAKRSRDVRCSVVNRIDSGESRWLCPGELETHPGLPEIVRSARALFGDGSIRCYGAGIPQAFLGDGGQVKGAAVHRLLNWE